MAGFTDLVNAQRIAADEDNVFHRAYTRFCTVDNRASAERAPPVRTRYRRSSGRGA
jgi:hypothetical protein